MFGSRHLRNPPGSFAGVELKPLLPWRCPEKAFAIFPEIIKASQSSPLSLREGILLALGGILLAGRLGDIEHFSMVCPLCPWGLADGFCGRCVGRPSASRCCLDCRGRPRWHLAALGCGSPLPV